MSRARNLVGFSSEYSIHLPLFLASLAAYRFFFFSFGFKSGVRNLLFYTPFSYPFILILPMTMSTLQQPLLLCFHAPTLVITYKAVKDLLITYFICLILPSFSITFFTPLLILSFFQTS